MNKTPILFIILLLLFSACKKEDQSIDIIEEVDNTPSKPNILLIISDDMGLDATPGYDIGTVKPNMPFLQKLINNGIRFSNVWSNPTCTPTRAGIITGKYGFRTNVTKVGEVLSTSEISLQKYLDNNTTGYENAVIGKWHLSNDANHPSNMGINHYAGLLSGGYSYDDWRLTENGQTTTSTEYMTSKISDLAIDWLDEQTEPWFLWLAYTAPHTPFHLPPNDLHTQGDLPSDEASIDANPLPYYMAMMEAMDTEMGRVLASLSQEELDNTIILFVGDNGTTNQVAQDYTRNRAKGSVYQGGISVPMIVSGKGVSRINDTEEALINTTDLFATVADIAGIIDHDINDSKSFKELLSNDNATKRTYIHTEIGKDSGGSDYTIRNMTHKYIKFENGNEALYDLSVNALESPNLLNANQLPLSARDSLMKEALILRLEEIRE